MVIYRQAREIVEWRSIVRSHGNENFIVKSYECVIIEIQCDRKREEVSSFLSRVTKNKQKYAKLEYY